MPPHLTAAQKQAAAEQAQRRPGQQLDHDGQHKPDQQAGGRMKMGEHEKT